MKKQILSTVIYLSALLTTQNASAGRDEDLASCRQVMSMTFEDCRKTCVIPQNEWTENSIKFKAKCADDFSNFPNTVLETWQAIDALGYYAAHSRLNKLHTRYLAIKPLLLEEDGEQGTEMSQWLHKYLMEIAHNLAQQPATRTQPLNQN